VFSKLTVHHAAALLHAYTCSYNGDGKLMVTTSDDDSINLYDCVEGSKLQTLHSKKYAHAPVPFSAWKLLMNRDDAPNHIRFICHCCRLCTARSAPCSRLLPPFKLRVRMDDAGDHTSTHNSRSHPRTTLVRMNTSATKRAQRDARAKHLFIVMIIFIFARNTHTR
jgi:hypothetical protein